MSEQDDFHIEAQYRISSDGSRTRIPNPDDDFKIIATSPTKPSRNLEDGDRPFFDWTEEETPELTSEQQKRLQGYIDEVCRPGMSKQECQQALAEQWRNVAWQIADLLRKSIKDDLIRRNDRNNEAWKTRFLSGTDLMRLAKKYSIPVCIYHMGRSHFVLVLTKPKKTNNVYTAEIYDPMRGGTKTINIPEEDFNNPQANKILVYSPNSNISLSEYYYPMKPTKKEQLLNQLDEVFGDDGYNLTVPHYSEDTEPLTLAKMEPLQNRDGYNCGLWCLIYAMTVLAYQGNETFMKHGFLQLLDDTGVLLVNPNDMGIAA